MNAKLSVFFSVLVMIAAGIVPGVASACIDRDRHAGTESTRFRFNGMRDEVAAHVARVARERGEVASHRVWAWRTSKARTSH